MESSYLSEGLGREGLGREGLVAQDLVSKDLVSKDLISGAWQNVAIAQHAERPTSAASLTSRHATFNNEDAAIPDRFLIRSTWQAPSGDFRGGAISHHFSPRVRWRGRFFQIALKNADFLRFRRVFA